MVDKVYTLDEIEDMLDALPQDEFRFDRVGEDALTYTGALRTVEGQNVIEPSPESSSMIIGLQPSINFLEAAPTIVRQLVQTIKDEQEKWVAEPDNSNLITVETTAPEKPAKVVNKGESAANKPISV
jgi:hypothetical protein